MSKYAGIIAKLEAATGPDRELGREVLLACGWEKTTYGYWLGPLYIWSSPDSGVSFKDDDFRQHDPTDSIDAALELVERILPESAYEIRGGHSSRDGGEPYAAISKDFKTPYVVSYGSTVCLSILIAMFRALEAQEQSK